jgi:CBS domain-containing protein
MKVVAEGRDPNSTTLDEVMTGRLVTCHPDDDLQKALDAMARHQLRRIPIVDDTDRVVGLIAQADVATRADEPVETAAVVKEISQANGI